MEILEPHEYNARLLKEQKARGETPNLAQPVLANLWETTAKKPVMRDHPNDPKAARGQALLPGGDAGVGAFDPSK